MPEFYITNDFVTPTECLSEALGNIQGLFIDAKYSSSFELTEGNGEVKLHSVLLIYKEITDE